MELYAFSYTILVLWLLASGSDAERYKNDLFDRYSEYGEAWMYFPDGEGDPLKVDLAGGPQELRGNPEAHIFFYLFTKSNPGKSVEMKLDDSENEVDSAGQSSLKSSVGSLFDPQRPTKMLVHGWHSSGSSNSITGIKDAYLLSLDCNVIVVDWEYLASSHFYFSSAYHTKTVGKKTARLIDALVQEFNMSTDQFHIVGHSLGAHASGYAGSAVTQGRVGRITGMDPALPGFEYWAGPEDRLDPEDAQFVDVIHTCAGVLGYALPLGHSDFYPNGGSPSQPGCSGVAELIEACSHGRSHEFFKESIFIPHAFQAKKCNNEREVKFGNCSGPGTFMGESASLQPVGVFHLKTNKKSPYGKEVEE